MTSAAAIQCTRRSVVLSAAGLGLFAKSGTGAAFWQVEENASEAAWDLGDLYASIEEWAADHAALNRQIADVQRHRGRIGDSAEALLKALEASSRLARTAERLHAYAQLKADEDLRTAENQERRRQAEVTLAAVGEATAWITPEILSLGRPKIEGFLATEPGLSRFAFRLNDTIRQAPHVLGGEAEQTVASAAGTLAGPMDVRNQLIGVEMPRLEVTLSTGERVRLDDPAFFRHRYSPVRADRKLVFDGFWEGYGKFENALGALLVSKIRGNLFLAKARRYGSALEWALSADRIPEGVYRTLLMEANRGLPQLHRYFDLRRRMLRLPDLHYYDLYPPLLSLDRRFSLSEMRGLMLEAMAPLGPEYTSRLARGLSARWMDPLPREGKSPGGYVIGTYDVHPYVFLNVSGGFEDFSTYAHEWGHAIHAELARSAQPFETYNASIFTSEIASTTNEQLLVDHMLAKAESRQEKLFYLGQKIEQFRTAFFRQAMLAEFELAAYERVEAGEGLSGTAFTQLYRELLLKYHGPAVQIDPAHAVEWAFIPHFFRDFYVFQYATSISGAVQFARELRNGGAAERERFLDVLRAGGSDYPVEILKRAGVDMTSPAPYRALVDEFAGVLDEAEALLRAA